MWLIFVESADTSLKTNEGKHLDGCLTSLRNLHLLSIIKNRLNIQGKSGGGRYSVTSTPETRIISRDALDLVGFLRRQAIRVRSKTRLDFREFGKFGVAVFFRSEHAPYGPIRQPMHASVVRKRRRDDQIPAHEQIPGCVARFHDNTFLTKRRAKVEAAALNRNGDSPILLGSQVDFLHGDSDGDADRKNEFGINGD